MCNNIRFAYGFIRSYKMDVLLHHKQSINAGRSTFQDTYDEKQESWSKLDISFSE